MLVWTWSTFLVIVRGRYIFSVYTEVLVKNQDLCRLACKAATLSTFLLIEMVSPNGLWRRIQVTKDSLKKPSGFLILLELSPFLGSETRNLPFACWKSWLQCLWCNKARCYGSGVFDSWVICQQFLPLTGAFPSSFSKKLGLCKVRVIVFLWFVWGHLNFISMTLWLLDLQAFKMKIPWSPRPNKEWSLGWSM